MQAGLDKRHALRAHAVLFIHNPSFGSVRIGVAVGFLVASAGPSGRSDAGAFGEKLAVNLKTSRENGPSELGRAGWRQAQGFVKTCAKVLARRELTTFDDFIDRRKAAADVLDQLGIDVWVVGDIEEKPTETHGGRVRTGDHEEICFRKELFPGICGSTGLRIFCFVQVMKHIFALVLILPRLFYRDGIFDSLRHPLIHESVVALDFLGCKPFENTVEPSGLQPHDCVQQGRFRYLSHVNRWYFLYLLAQRMLYRVPEPHVGDYYLRNHFEGILARLFDAKRLSKAEIPQDIKNQAVNPFGKVDRLRPVMAHHRQLIPSIDVLDDERCCRA